MLTKHSSLKQLPRRASQTLFQAGQGGYDLYRIPVLAATARGTLLAACEARRGNRGDWHETHLLMRRSENGGVTWDAARSIHDDHRGQPVNPVRPTGFDGGLVHGNAVFIPGPDETVHLVYCFEYHRVFHRISRDDGRTWGTAREITAALDPIRHRYPFRVCATGPGHGVRQSDGTLTVPVWLSLGSGNHGHNPSVVSVLRGEAEGRDWRVGDLVAVDGDHAADGRRIHNPSESALVPLHDGSLLLGMRTKSEPNRRLHAVSCDGGRTFSHPTFVDALFDAVCEASYARHGNRLLFSAPDPRDDGPERVTGSNDRVKPRRRLVLTASDDEGLSWHQLGVVEPGLAGYSHLAVHAGRVWCLNETGSTDGNHYRTGSLVVSELEVA
jgi:sialidase-1